jgi:hypothetical protein
MAVRILLENLNRQFPKKGKITNRFLLDALDFGCTLPGVEQRDIPMKSWKETVSKEVDCERSPFEKALYSDLYLPIRMLGKWLLLVSSPCERVTHTIVFDRWDWEHPNAVKALEMMAG